MARILIGYSCCPLTRAAFEQHGHEVWTCDLLPARDASSNHLQGDIWQFLGQPWDMAVLHPMCTYLTTSAAWAYGDGPYHQRVKPGTLTGQNRLTPGEARWLDRSATYPGIAQAMGDTWGPLFPAQQVAA